MIAVTGASGAIGRTVLPGLRAGGHPVRAMTRDAETARSLRADEAAAVIADLSDPASLRTVFEGADVALLLSSVQPDLTGQQANAVEAASAAGVGHLVKVGGGTAITGRRSPSFAGRAHWQVEQRIRASSASWTFLRPGYFMKNLLGLAQPIATGRLPIPIPALTDPTRHRGAVHELTGPQALTMGEVAEVLSAVLGHDAVNAPVAHGPVRGALGAQRLCRLLERRHDHGREDHRPAASNPALLYRAPPPIPAAAALNARCGPPSARGSALVDRPQRAEGGVRDRSRGSRCLRGSGLTSDENGSSPSTRTVPRIKAPCDPA